MNRRFFVRTGLMTAAGAALFGGEPKAAGGKVGRLSYARWDQLVAEAAGKVDAIVAAGGDLSVNATSWLLRLAADSTRHFEVSRLVLDRGTDPDVRAFARGEAEEHVHLGAKLREIAAAKRVTMPAGWDDLTTQVVAMFKGFGTAELHRTYVHEIGQVGHINLRADLLNLAGEASDATLKRLVAVVMPIVEAHLAIAEDLAVQKGGKRLP